MVVYTWKKLLADRPSTDKSAWDSMSPTTAVTRLPASFLVVLMNVSCRSPVSTSAVARYRPISVAPISSCTATSSPSTSHVTLAFGGKTSHSNLAGMPSDTVALSNIRAKYGSGSGSAINGKMQQWHKIQRTVLTTKRRIYRPRLYLKQNKALSWNNSALSVSLNLGSVGSWWKGAITLMMPQQWSTDKHSTCFIPMWRWFTSPASAPRIGLFVWCTMWPKINLFNVEMLINLNELSQTLRVLHGSHQR